MQSELRLIIHENLQGLSDPISIDLLGPRQEPHVRHELLARNPDILCQGGAEHHDLLVVRSGPEDLLNISAHVWRDDVENGEMQRR